jgi:hypothetical protein
MRNIIIATGPIADGKTTLIGRLRQEFARRKIPQSLDVISDGAFLLEAIKWDHKHHRGAHHMHEGQSIPVVHDHSEEPKNYDFVAAGAEIQTFMFKNFFSQLANVRDTPTIVFAELAGGGGEFFPGNPLAANDYSYRHMVDGLTSGVFEKEWIHHLFMVIHPSSEFSDRVRWNKDRLVHPPSDEDISAGRASWGVPEVVMGNTKHDDFDVFQQYLESHGVHRSRIETITNGGNAEFFGQAMAALERQGIGLPEGQSSRKEIR